MFKVVKKLIPFQKTEAQKPKHAGEVYYLWEGLAGGYKFIETAEMYLMNTEDTEIQLALKALTKGTFILTIQRLEKELKEEGFTVPPRPASKLDQGMPGDGQEVKFTDREVIKNVASMNQLYIMFYTRAVMASTRDSVRKIFKDLLNDHIFAYKTFINMGKKRNIFDPPPPATARKNPLNMSEVGIIWDEINFRHLSQVNMEVYLSSTRDNDLIKLIQWGQKEIVMAQMNKFEKLLKNEGITVPPRPTIRTYQYTPGQVNKIRTSDDETLGLLTLAFQSAIVLHSRALVTILRDDLFDLFEGIIFKEFEAYEKLLSLAKSRYALKNPPTVSSLRI